MIVRILGEGQFDVADDAIERLNQLDEAVEAAVEAGDETAFRTALDALLDAVRSGGTPHDEEDLRVSQVILPPADASITEVRDLLDDDGLIPG
jgi:hypothetical protein